MSERPPGGELPERQFHASKLKLGLLIVPCLLGAGAALQSDTKPEFAITDIAWVNGAALAICLFVAFLLLRMAMEKEPVVVLNADGLHCRRPPVGSIPWSAVVGIAAGRAVLMRRVLMVGVDPQQLDAQGREYFKNSVGALALISPQVNRFQRYSQGYPTVSIPISLLAASPSTIERAVREHVNHYIIDED
jgi:hypothetical protein